MTPESLEDDFRKEAFAIKRPGVKELIEYLSETDFFLAPASTKFHGAHPGGLVLHSLSVLDAMTDMDKTFELKIDRKKIVTCALFHDVCKANFYVKATRNKKINGQWHEIVVWEVKDQFPLGHGEKSLYLIQKFVALDDDEALAIRWHMGGFDPGVHFQYPTGSAYSQAMRQNKLVALLTSADLAASYLVEEWPKED